MVEYIYVLQGVDGNQISRLIPAVNSCFPAAPPCLFDDSNNWMSEDLSISIFSSNFTCLSNITLSASRKFHHSETVHDVMNGIEIHSIYAYVERGNEYATANLWDTQPRMAQDGWYFKDASKPEDSVIFWKRSLSSQESRCRKMQKLR